MVVCCESGHGWLSRPSFYFTPLSSSLLSLFHYFSSPLSLPLLLLQLSFRSMFAAHYKARLRGSIQVQELTISMAGVQDFSSRPLSRFLHPANTYFSAFSAHVFRSPVKKHASKEDTPACVQTEMGFLSSACLISSTPEDYRWWMISLSEASTALWTRINGLDGTRLLEDPVTRLCGHL